MSASGESVSVLAALRARPSAFPFTRWTPRCWAHLLGGALLGPPLLVALTVLLALGLGLSVVGLGLPVLLALALAGIPVGAVERWRLRLVEPVPLPDPHSRLPGAGPRARLRTRLRERATWRELAFAALTATVLAASCLGFALLLILSFAYVLSPLIVWALAPETVMLIPGHAVGGPIAALPFSAAGLAGLLLCAYAGALLTGAQVALARLLIGPRRDDLGHRVLELTRSRARLADAFEAERRRLERDLHDGAQQQLVALSMTLGLVEYELQGAGRASELVARARGEAREALEQLRGLVRGIHPPVLTDHGLAAAVDEVALRHPIPVAVDIDLPGRLPAPVESTAYFTVTEALTNAAKHGGASAITVHGRVERGRLLVQVTDDGGGGADPAAGAGLAGLADRAALLDGRLTVTSPVGGPTTLRLEVPCSAS
ncbi:sensor histidine kinase [Streptomyces sp. NRRL WC-3742]|uniref:sensor histidine kinase n=1 Tax=Streptomyces sp. NRRL WC-3742 TaxID=1463934 RepID=UPI00068AA41E|nr:sensor histidine kinase [Streptomyces sp. NRRL WC-3742]